MSNQHTSEIKPVSKGLAKQVGRMVEDASLKYPGGLAKLELVKGDPDFIQELYSHFDARATKRAETLAITERPAWKTVKLGTYESVQDLSLALIDGGNKISDWAADVLKRTPVADELTEVDLIVLTVAELGFPNGATRKEIYEKALSLGLQLLPAEVGPQLRLQYSDQPNGEWILIGMEPISDSDGYLRVFYVGRDFIGRWLNGVSGSPDLVWNGSDRWAFLCK